MTKNALLIRADASPEIGTGHIMRCLALAEAWQDDGGEVFFVSVCDAPSIEDRLKREGMPVFHIRQEAGTSGDADETIRIAHEQEAEWIVVDGYHFDAKYQKTIKDAGFSLIFIDDYGHADHYYADIVLNQNIYADMSFYKNYEPYTRFLLGTKYVLLRREFLKYSDWHRDIPEVARKILITLGGSDPDNVTLKVIDAVKTVEIDGLEAKVVAGGANPHFNLLHETVKGHSDITLIKNAENMPELMAWADIAISAGGSTCWELLFMGLPSIIIPTVDNQKPNAALLKTKDLIKCVEIDEISDLEALAKKIMNLLRSYDSRISLSNSMRKLIDGRGASHVTHYISSCIIKMRPIENSDCALIFSWINEDTVRVNSFHPEKISLTNHKKWFSSVITDKTHIYYIALDMYDRPIGQARFKIRGRDAVISILLASNHRGINLGSELIRCATKRFFDDTQIEKVHAYIKTTNNSSLKAFIRAGYIPKGTLKLEDQMAHHVIVSRCE